MPEFDIEIVDRTFVRDRVEVVERGVLAVDLADYVSVADKVAWVPGSPIVITSIDPPRARYPENIVINGSGFSARAGENEVNISGSFAAIVSESATQLTVQLPFFLSIADDFLAEVEVINLTHDTRGYAWLWVKDSLASVAAYSAGPTEPSTSEMPNDDRPDFAEAQDFERLLSLIEFVSRDTTDEAGDVISRDDVGLWGVQGGKPGQILIVDPTAVPGLAFKWAADMILSFGGSIVANPGGVVNLVANGHQDSTVSGTNTRNYIPFTCRIDLLWVLIKFSGATDRIDRIRLIENGVTVRYDSGAGLALGNNAVHRVELDVAGTGEKDLELEITKTGTTDSVKLVGGVRLRL